MPDMVVLLLLLTSILTHVCCELGDDCPYKDCYCPDTNVYCTNTGWNTIPPKQTCNNSINWSLYFQQNVFTRIPSGSLPANLSSLVIENTPIDTIDDTAFDESMYTLQQLTFSQVTLSRIPAAVFHLKSLTILSISATNITDWDPDGMNQLGLQLQQLLLYSVNFSTWPTWMTSLTNLTSLTLSSCSVSSIPDDAFNTVAHSLTNLNLENNALTLLPKSMSNLLFLNSLSLSTNKITNLNYLSQSTQLNTLFLNNNTITDAQKLSDILTYSANTLINFAIDNNFLTSIPNLSLLTLIRSIHLGSNHISNANSGSFSNTVVSINFENNLLTSIPSTMNNLTSITGLFFAYNNIHTVHGSYIPTSVISIDLSYNSISELTKSSFPVNSSLNYLMLNNNPLSVVSLDAFTNINTLLELYIIDTSLTRVPLAITSLTKITSLNLQNNAHLVCTCMEQSLYGSVTKLGPDGVYGDCGVMSVYQFYVQLSPQCPHM